MAPKKPNLAAALDEMTPPRAALSAASRPRRSEPADTGDTVLVGANLPPAYARNLAILHAETGKSKKELLQEALKMLFVSQGGRSITPV